MAGSEEQSAFTMTTMMDETYEFSAPRFFDFVNGETEEDMRKAEFWFEDALPYAPSPLMLTIKADRCIKLDNLCDFSEAEKMHEAMSSEAESTGDTSMKQPLKEIAASVHERSSQAKKEDVPHTKDSTIIHDGRAPAAANEVCTPNPLLTSQKGVITTSSKKHVTAKKIANFLTNPSAMRTNLRSSLLTRTPKPVNVMSAAPSPHIHQENQAIKKQKLDGGKSRQILNGQPQSLPHKSKLGLISMSSSAAGKIKKEDRKVYVREATAATPFVSMAEMMKKFQSSTRDLPLPQTNSSLWNMKPKLTLTRPKEPEFETAQRVRSVKIKSTTELEEEMLAKIPKFKARRLNKKILQAPTLPAVPRSIPRPPEFQEFHLETLARARQNAEMVSIASTEVSHKDNQWKSILTEPKTPILQTSLRARPAKVKSSFELEQEELEKMPKFKAKTLNKKIFESKGELGLFCNVKKHITIPQEFRFATNERIQPPLATVADLFDKLALKSKPDHPIPRNTHPKPFHLLTEERGAEKEKKFKMEVTLKQVEEERARVQKANPFPYTTDYPVIPPKPEPKHCTELEPFPLESLVRHEEEMQREMEERQRKEREEAKMRIFTARPVLKDDPISVPEKVRKPFTEIKEFNLQVDHRAEDRAQFDQRIKEKEMMYKRYREENEATQRMEEEKALKQLRRTLVPRARPVPNFNHPFCPHKSNKETAKAKSPNLRVIKRKERRKTANVMAKVSSAAANMR